MDFFLKIQELFFYYEIFFPNFIFFYINIKIFFEKLEKYSDFFQKNLKIEKN